METAIKFFKSGNEWYADVEGHTMEENQMVAGSDVFLETVNNLLGGRGTVNAVVSDDNQRGTFLAKLVMRAHNQYGATYVLTGPEARRHGAEGFELWICNVTHDVLGEHPRSIYIHEVR